MVVERSNDFLTHYIIPWEQCRLRVFENRVLRRLFGPKRDVVTGEWRKLHNEERIGQVYTGFGGET